MVGSGFFRTTSASAIDAMLILFVSRSSADQSIIIEGPTANEGHRSNREVPRFSYQASADRTSFAPGTSATKRSGVALEFKVLHCNTHPAGKG